MSLLFFIFYRYLEAVTILFSSYVDGSRPVDYEAGQNLSRPTSSEDRLRQTQI